MTQNDRKKIPIVQQEIISTNPNSASKFIRDAIRKTSNWVVNIGNNIMNITNDLIGWF